MSLIRTARSYPGADGCDATRCTQAPYTADASINLIIPNATSSPQAPKNSSCVVGFEGLDISVADKDGAMLAFCHSPTASQDNKESSCSWTQGLLGNRRDLHVNNIGMRTRSMELLFAAMLNNVPVARSPLIKVNGSVSTTSGDRDVTVSSSAASSSQPSMLSSASSSVLCASSIHGGLHVFILFDMISSSPRLLQSMSMELWEPGKLHFLLRMSSEPLPGVAITLLRCWASDVCWPAYNLAEYSSDCIPRTTSQMGSATFAIWPPLPTSGASDAAVHWSFL